MNHPLVSFVIAAYNEEKYIVECIDSCLNQTYPNIEVCVTDDGSTDRTWDALIHNYQNHPGVILDRFDRNRGKIFAFNNSYRHASGDFISVIGADDVCLQDRIENSYKFLKENNYDLVFGKKKYCDEKLSPLNYCQRKVRKNSVKLERIIFDNICDGPTLFLNRNIAEKCFPIPENLLFEDWWIGFISILYGKAGFLNKDLVKYRQHDNNDNSNIYDSQIIARLKKDFSRHDEYYTCFYAEIEKNNKLVKKDKYLKLIKLNVIYRKLFMEDDFNVRLRLLPALIKNMTPCVPFFAALMLMAFGNGIYNLKKTKVYKRLFYYNTDPFINAFE
jgi:glycosyltransferase involved in cell wall biosynthesis